MSDDSLFGKSLHPDVAKRVLPRFQNEFFDDAVLHGFIVLEEKLRAIMGIDEVGVKLVQQAFNPQTGLLTDSRALPSEKVGIFHLFQGAFESYRNAPAHHTPNYGPELAFDLIVLINRLVLIVEQAYSNRCTLLAVANAHNNRIAARYDDTMNAFWIDVDGDGVEEVFRSTDAPERHIVVCKETEQGSEQIGSVRAEGPAGAFKQKGTVCAQQAPPRGYYYLLVCPIGSCTSTWVASHEIRQKRCVLV